MAQFQAFQKGIEVNGVTILSIVKGMGAFTKAAYDILKDAGLEEVKEEQNEWYSQEMWLSAFKNISEKTGEKTLYSIGLKIPESAEFPPDIDSVEKALASIDIAYHMNHRNAKGEILFDPNTGKMLEGIGHYKFSKTDDNSGVMVCENPYPDQFDKGIIYAIAKKFAKTMVKVDIDESKPTRSVGSDSTTYIIKWR